MSRLPAVFYTVVTTLAALVVGTLIAAVLTFVW